MGLKGLMGVFSSFPSTPLLESPFCNAACLEKYIQTAQYYMGLHTILLEQRNSIGHMYVVVQVHVKMFPIAHVICKLFLYRRKGL